MAALARREAELLCGRQGIDGGWAYYDRGFASARPSGVLSTSFNTATALLALRSAHRAGIDVPRANIVDGLAALRRMAQPDGSYAYSSSVLYRGAESQLRIPGSIGRTQAAHLARHIWDPAFDPAHLLTGLRQFRQHHHYLRAGQGRPKPHESWYAVAGYYHAFGHHHAAAVAAALPDSPERRGLTHWLHRAITDSQNPDGSWLDFPLYGFGRAYATAYMLDGLNTLEALEAWNAPTAPRPARPTATATDR